MIIVFKKQAWTSSISFSFKSDEITGHPSCIASIFVIPNPSYLEVLTKAKALEYKNESNSSSPWILINYLVNYIYLFRLWKFTSSKTNNIYFRIIL